LFGAVFAQSLSALGAVAARRLRTGPDSYFPLSCDPTLVSLCREHTGLFFCCCFFGPPCAVVSGLVLFGSLSQFFLLSDFFTAWSHDLFLASISVAGALLGIVLMPSDQRLKFFFACVVLS
jgi:hypothetical protein